jgi:hypothetical protein
MATITVTDLATELNTDPRTARKFLRSITPADAQPGKGSRWAIEKREVRSLKSKFAKFEQAAQDARDAKRTPEVIAEELGIDDPTDEQLEEIAMLDLA